MGLPMGFKYQLCTRCGRPIPYGSGITSPKNKFDRICVVCLANECVEFERNRKMGEMLKGTQYVGGGDQK